MNSLQNFKFAHNPKISRRKFIINNFLVGSGGLFLNSITPSYTIINSPGELEKRKLKPVLVGDWWLIGPPPPASAKIPSGRVTGENPGFESVDHHAFLGDDGLWHLWGCVRGTGLGRILYHWKAKELTDSPWELTGEFIRADTSVGECIDDFHGQEWMQSPYFIKEDGKYYMFYGGHSTGRNNQGVPASGEKGRNPDAECQICLMTSDDGLIWERHLHKDGFSRLFIGPGETRDPCLIKVDGLWYMYYAGYEDRDHYKGAIFLRTSRDLINWSDYSLVHWDPTFGAPGWWWDHECPFVANRDGYFYLFRTENYRNAITHVYRSEHPRNFGINAESAQQMYVGILPAAAPEIYEYEGEEYVSSNHHPGLGTQMSKMKWEPV